jgi:hypothetical protein
MSSSDDLFEDTSDDSVDAGNAAPLVAAKGVVPLCPAPLCPAITAAAASAPQAATKTTKPTKKRSHHKHHKHVDPNAPKKPRTSYIWFAKTALAQIKQRHIDNKEDVKQMEIMREGGACWQQLGPEARKPYEDMAARDMVRYKNECAAYAEKHGSASSSDSSSSTEKRSPKKKAKTADPNAPKRPMGAFVLFCQAYRIQVTQKMKELEKDNYSAKHVTQELSRQWKSAGEAERKKWTDAARGRKKTYDVELAAYKVKRGLDIRTPVKIKHEHKSKTEAHKKHHAETKKHESKHAHHHHKPPRRSDAGDSSDTTSTTSSTDSS